MAAVVLVRRYEPRATVSDRSKRLSQTSAPSSALQRLVAHCGDEPYTSPSDGFSFHPRMRETAELIVSEPDKHAADVPVDSLKDKAELGFLRLAAGGMVPASWYLPELPATDQRAARTGRLSLEIVSHCWRYSHLLVYQLSSLLLHPPREMDVTMTVFHAAEDPGTVALLNFFAAHDVPGVTWNWRTLDKGHLFRRAIGRNLAAKETAADWIWFTDCDVVFGPGCLDRLNHLLQGRRDALVFPQEEWCSDLLESEAPLLKAGGGEPQVVDIDHSDFTARQRDRATGPLQITHGDVARACGYCEGLRYYQKPSRLWAKAYEDRAFRWLLRTQGVALDVPGVHRIRHVSKGRYQGGRTSNSLRALIRRYQIGWRERDTQR